MRILHVCQNYYPSKGGPQYTMKHVSEKLGLYYNDDVTVCTTNSLYLPESPLFKKVTPAFEVLNGVKIHRLPFNRWHYPLIKYGNKILAKTTGKPLPATISSLRYSLDSPAIKKFMLKSDADVIMATTVSYNFCYYPLWRFKCPQPKPFVLYGAIHLHKKITDYNDPSLVKARICDCYIANTDYERDELISYGVHAEKIVTTGTGIDVNDYTCQEKELADFKAQYGIFAGDIVVGFVGRLVKGKGVGILLDAIRKLTTRVKGIKLLLAGGTTEYVPVIKRAAAEEKLPIILIEDFNDNLKPLLFNAIDVFVLASQSESFGVVFLEAWACKKPVIGTNMGAIASLVSNEHDGLLFEANNADALADKIALLANNENLRKEYGNKGYKKVQAKFTWEVIVKKYRDAYLTGIDNFKRSTP